MNVILQRVVGMYIGTQEGGNDENKEALIIAQKKSKVTEEHKDNSNETSSNSVLDELALKETKFYNDKIGLSP